MRKLLFGSIPVHTGNRVRVFHIHPYTRSIPVHTGEPKTGGTCADSCWVYPRTHGGTAHSVKEKRQSLGLSPYTRGTFSTHSLSSLTRGLSPYTRGTAIIVFLLSVVGVYPRTHGGTRWLRLVGSLILGLSPYTRGNHAGIVASGDRVGSIPVHTGEPIRGLIRNWQYRVYPRTHGGTL